MAHTLVQLLNAPRPRNYVVFDNNDRLSCFPQRTEELAVVVLSVEPDVFDIQIVTVENSFGDGMETGVSADYFQLERE